MSRSIPTNVVYITLYAVTFAISGWILIFHPDSGTNLILYLLLTFAILAALIKLYLHRRKSSGTSTKPTHF